jgi:hypothetical protein
MAGVEERRPRSAFDGATTPGVNGARRCAGVTQDVVERGSGAMFIDYEDDAPTFVERLRRLGVPGDIIIRDRDEWRTSVQTKRSPDRQRFRL